MKVKERNLEANKETLWNSIPERYLKDKKKKQSIAEKNANKIIIEYEPIIKKKKKLSPVKNEFLASPKKSNNSKTTKKSSKVKAAKNSKHSKKTAKAAKKNLKKKKHL